MFCVQWFHAVTSVLIYIWKSLKMRLSESCQLESKNSKMKLHKTFNTNGVAVIQTNALFLFTNSQRVSVQILHHQVILE
jgi:hypothetical protein